MRRSVGVRTGSGLRLERLEARKTPAVVGTLDPSFGTAGKVTTDFGFDDPGAAVALQPDGKVVVVGTFGLVGGSQFAVARYNPDGTPDNTFDGDGKALVDLLGFASANAVAIQPDGKIVVAGSTRPNGAPLPGQTTDMGIVRLNPHGTLDGTFNATGKLTVDLGGDESATGVAIRSDGRIVVVGSNGAAGDFVVVQLTGTGGFDATFKGGGKTTYDLGGTDAASAVALQPDGKAVVVGATTAGGSPADNFAVLRIDAAGNPDSTFGGGDGIATVDFGFDDEATAVALQPDGKIVAAGFDAGTSADFAIARLNTDGTPDATFSGDGLMTVTFGGVEKVSGVAVQPDGRIVVAGSTDATGGGDFAIVRLLPTGFLDTSFGPLGMRTVDFGVNDVAGGIALTPTGRIVIAGSTGAALACDFAVARLIGTVEQGRDLVVSGTLNGAAVAYTPNTATGVYNTTTAFSVAPFGGFAGNVRTAVADVNGDGFQDTIVVSGPGITVRFTAISGKDNTTVLVPVSAPFSGSESFTGGGFVAAADLDNDGRAEIIVTPDQSGGARVTVFSLLPNGFFQRASFLGIDDPNFRGGARAAAGDVNGDGFADVAVAAGFLGGPRVAIFDGKTVLTTQTKLVNDFFAFPGPDAVTLRNGGYVAIGDVNGDGFADLIFGGGPGGAPRVLVLNGSEVVAGNTTAALANFFVAGNSTDRGGIRVAAADVDGDNRVDVAVGTGLGVVSRARVYFGNVFTGGGEPGVSQDFDPFAGAPLADGVYVG